MKAAAVASDGSPGDPRMAERPIDRERAAFEAQLERLLEDHEGKAALFHDCELVALFESSAAAYEEGLRQFGADEVFLVALVVRPDPTPVSIAWSAGVMFG